MYISTGLLLVLAATSASAATVTRTVTHTATHTATHTTTRTVTATHNTCLMSTSLAAVSTSKSSSRSSTKASTTSSRRTTTTSTTTSAAATASVAPDGSPYNGGKSILSIINKWRATVPVGSLAWSNTLQANALKTGTDNKGVNQNHELNPGSYAQVIAPGLYTAGSFDLEGDTPFELDYVAWLCEKPTTALVNGTINQCQLVQNVLHISYSGTGHADILRSSSYKTIGCAFTQNPDAAASSPYQGLWVCDLGF